MKPELKRRLLAAGSVAVIIASCIWIYLTQLHTANYNVGLHRRIGQMLAEQSAVLIGKRGHIVTIAIDTKEWPELKTQIDAFKVALRKLGEFEVRAYEMDTKDQPKYGVGSGLSGRRFVRTVKKNPNADLFVSFVGAPRLSEEEIADLGKKPKFIAESRSGDNLPDLFEHQLIQVAIVSRFQFPAPGPERPHTPEEWFTKRYQILTSEGARALTKSE